VPSFQGLYWYYEEFGLPGYGKIKQYVGLEPESNDSLYKYKYSYDEKGANSEIIFQYYDSINNIWDNFSLTLIHYDRFGYDSCSLFKSWDNNTNSWLNSEQHLMYRNDQKAIIFDVNESWTGTGWYRYLGHKFDYFNNGFACSDSIHIFDWYTDIDDWFMKHKWFLHYDENNIQTWGRDIVFDEQLQAWRNYQQTLDYEFNNWCSCEEYWSCTSNPTHFIIQNWYDTSWVNMERLNAVYDSLGGNLTIFEAHNGENWCNYKKVELRIMEDGEINFLKEFDWLDEQWKQTGGYNTSYNYFNDTLIETVVDKWDADNMDWMPHKFTKYKNYILLSGTNSIFENKKNPGNKIKLMPNPSTGYLTIEIVSDEDTIQEIEIYDQSGKKVYSSSVIKSQTKNTTIDISKLNAGIYLVSIKTSNSEVIQSKLIKQ